MCIFIVITKLFIYIKGRGRRTRQREIEIEKRVTKKIYFIPLNVYFVQFSFSTIF